MGVTPASKLLDPDSKEDLEKGPHSFEVLLMAAMLHEADGGEERKRTMEGLQKKGLQPSCDKQALVDLDYWLKEGILHGVPEKILRLACLLYAESLKVCATRAWSRRAGRYGRRGALGLRRAAREPARRLGGAGGRGAARRGGGGPRGERSGARSSCPSLEVL